jgi:hypothetical protein
MDLAFRSNPNLNRALKRAFRVRIEAWQRWGGVGQSFPEDLVRSKSRMFCDRNETMMMENARAVRRSVDAHEEGPRKKKSENHSTKERSSTELRFASFPAQLCSDLRGCQGSR